MKKLNRKGFSLIEILAVITIMGILATVGTTAVYRYLTKTRNQAVDTIVSTSYDGAVNYMMKENVLLNPNTGSGCTIENGCKIVLDIVDDLYENQYIDRPTDPVKNADLCTGSVTVENKTTDDTEGLEEYEYTVEVNCSGRYHQTKTFSGRK